MNILLENGHISEMNCGDNFAYILRDNGLFLPTEYKVLQSRTDGCFVRCMKMLFNGSIQLYYMTAGLRPLSAVLPMADAQVFRTVVANLLADIQDVKQNGFLSCCNIDMRFDRIYVDPKTYKVQLVYLPLSERAVSDNAVFENELRTALVKQIAAADEPALTGLAADLANGMLTLEDLQERIREEKPQPRKEPPKPREPVLRLIATNAPQSCTLYVDKYPYTIGKNADLVDGAVTFNKMISRIHCRIDRTGGKYTLVDLQSANGTYINNQRLRPNQAYPLTGGDVVRLANSDFQVSID